MIPNLTSSEIARLSLLKYAKVLQRDGFCTVPNSGSMRFELGAPAGLIMALAHLDTGRKDTAVSRALPWVVKDIVEDGDVSKVEAYWPKHTDVFEIHHAAAEVVSVIVFRDAKGVATHAEYTARGGKFRFSDSATWTGKFEFFKLERKGFSTLKELEGIRGCAGPTEKPSDKLNPKKSNRGRKPGTRNKTNKLGMAMDKIATQNPKAFTNSTFQAFIDKHGGALNLPKVTHTAKEAEFLRVRKRLADKN